MTIIEKPGNLKKIKITFWINLIITVVSMIIFIKTVDSMILWKIIASGIGCLCFLALTVLVFIQLMKIQKQNK